MKITYKRELKHNYLIIEPEEVFYDSYEIRMMASNGIDGLLKFHVKQVDSRKSYYYEITSRQPLSRLLECHNIGAKELRCLISGIGQTISRLDAYLLQEEQILLEPEFIYVEPERYETSLCLMPGRQGDFPGDMTKLLQYLLGKVDHQDKECVVLAYGLYQESLKENYGIDNLLKLLLKELDENGPYISRDNMDKEDMGRTAGPLKENSTGTRRQDYFTGGEENMAWVRSNRENMADDERKELETAEAHSMLPRLMPLIGVIVGGPLLAWFLDGINGLINYWYLLLGADVVAFLFFLYQLSQAKEEKKVYSAARSEKPKEKDIRKPEDRKTWPEKTGKYDWQMTFADEEPTEQEKDQAGMPDEEEIGTVLLTEPTKKEGMRYLRAMGEDSEDIIISYVPFIIGKQEGLVDFVLNRDTVSRLHARIDREGEDYRITDLNSTNGTIVGKKVLETNETVALLPGDKVYIANLGFIFT